MFEELSCLEEHYLRCVRCGQCRSVCPVFNEIRTEAATPRAKVFIAHQLVSGGLQPGPEVLHQLSLCLLCQACARECPSAIPVPRIVTAARSLLARARPSRLKKMIYRGIWTRPALLKLSAGLVRGCQSLKLPDLAAAAGLLSHGVTMPGRMPRRSARSLLPETTSAAGPVRLRIGYFLGCSTNYFFPGLAAGTVAVLSRLGCEVVIPRDTRCCGLPQLAAGEADTARHLAAANLASFQRLGVEMIVTDCASCTSTLQDLAQQDQAGPALTDLARLLADLLTYADPGLDQLKEAVTYHEPCHLARSPGINGSPRALLNLTCRDFRELPGATACCGAGGAFALTHYEVSRGILAKKTAAVKETGADLVATFCPSCLMQLRHGLRHNNSGARAVHVIELLARSLKIKIIF